METKLKMNEIYALLERRVEKCAQYVRSLGVTRRLTKLERADHALDFATEFTSLTSAVLGLFAPGSLSIVDLQREFELAAHDEELCTMAEEGENGKEGENAKEEEIPTLRATGELELSDGRILGNREYTRYYKQSYATESERREGRGGCQP